MHLRALCIFFLLSSLAANFKCLYSQSLQDSLIIYYPLNGDAIDAGPNNLNGSYYASPAADCRGNLNMATYFDGINDTIGLPNSNLLQPQLPVTISFQVKIEDLPSISQRIFASDYNSYTYTGINVNISTSNYLMVNWRDGNGYCKSLYRSGKVAGSPLQLDKWQVVTFVIKGKNDVDIFIDCQNVNGSYDGESTGGLAYTANPRGVIAKRKECGRLIKRLVYFEGYLDNFYFWNRALDTTEISSLCSSCSCSINNVIDTTICQGDTFTLGSQKLTTSGKYNDSFTTLEGCDSTVSLTLTVESLYQDSISILICEGDTFNFEGRKYFQEGTYYDTSYNANSCPKIKLLQLTKIDTVDFSITGDTTFCKGASATLSSSIAYSLIWSTGDTTNKVKVNKESIYWAELNTSCGTVRDSILVMEKDCKAVIHVPNIFTPNGDGMHEIFYIKGNNVNKFNITIYNRWGQQVFQSKHINYSWDGRKGGKLVAEGIYVYLIRYTDANNITHTLKGMLTLLR